MENAEFACSYNRGVDCALRAGCESCGWNPEVHKKRVKAVRRETERRLRPKMRIGFPEEWEKNAEGK